MEKQKNLEEIKKELISGNNEWLEVLYIQHKDYFISTLIVKRNCNEDEANDLFTETLLIIYKNVLSGKITTLSSIRSYIVRVGINISQNKNYYKSQAIKKEEEVRSFLYENNEVEKSDNYKDKLIEICQNAIQTLSVRCQQIINAFYLDRMTMKEIASLLNLSSADVAKTLKSRCYKSLQEKISIDL